ncbi:MAG TPA: hypothetical protein PK002_02450 [Cellvibrio sp.]|nr:hypothetical protein [Cellvibrio sp.]
MQTKHNSRSLEMIGKFFGFAIIVVVGTHWFFNGREEPQIKSNQVTIAHDSYQEFANHEPTPNISSEKNNAGETKDLSHADLSDHDSWMKDMGYSRAEDQSNYAYYDDKTILALAKNNDLLAIKALAKKAIDNHDFEAAKKYYWHAAAVGATPALDQLASLAEPTPYDKEQGMPYVRSKFFDELAICKVIEMRGDIGMARIASKNAINNYEHYFGVPELSQADQQQILQLAGQKYSELQATRTMLGLGDFKNSTSKLVEVIEKR